LNTKPLGVIHQFLLEQDFEKVSGSPSYLYEGVLEVDGVSFTIEIAIVCPEFLTIPAVRVIKWPEDISLTKPHLEDDGKLCYLDPQTTVFNRYTPEISIQYIFLAIIKLLKSYLDKNIDDMKYQYAAEFTAYWKAKHLLFLRSKLKKSLLAKYNDATQKGVGNIVYSDEEQLKYWLKTRNIKEIKYIDKFVPVIFVTLKVLPFIYSDNKWPPNSMKDYMDWLKSVDTVSLKKLMSDLASKLKSKKQVVVVTLTESGHIAFHLNYLGKEIDSRINNILKKNDNRLRNFLSQPFAIKNEQFTRYFVEDVTDERIVTRNLPDLTQSLIGKKIVLIGAGTIGGFAAFLLTQVGAGLKNDKGIGQLDIVDGDYLSSDNIGRHILDITSIMKNKAIATKEYLVQRSFSEKLSINAIQKNLAVENFKNLNSYDLVIDATGMEEFSNAINHYHYHENLKPPVLHAWLELSGKAARGILVDKTGACYRCLRHKDNSQRIPLVTNKTIIPEAISRDCGNSYFPYSSSSSAVSAAMIQKMVLDHFMENLSPKFRHISLSDDVQNAKSSNLTKLQKCPCCNDM
jgi:molybdopterin/thiamine biosynthesis adenylyltransferase